MCIHCEGEAMIIWKRKSEEWIAHGYYPAIETAPTDVIERLKQEGWEVKVTESSRIIPCK